MPAAWDHRLSPIAFKSKSVIFLLESSFQSVNRAVELTETQESVMLVTTEALPIESVDTFVKSVEVQRWKMCDRDSEWQLRIERFGCLRDRRDFRSSFEHARSARRFQINNLKQYVPLRVPGRRPDACLLNGQSVVVTFWPGLRFRFSDQGWTFFSVIRCVGGDLSRSKASP